MGSPFRCQGDTGRGAHHDEATPAVQRVEEGVEAPENEGVVNRADRQQLLTVVLVGESELSQE
ncbi:hypothetical protein BH23ACT5_BH23ACT5_00530 [soil metagenome]